MRMKLTRKWISGMPRELWRNAARCDTMQRPARSALLGALGPAERITAQAAAESEFLRITAAAIIGAEREVAAAVLMLRLRRAGLDAPDVHWLAAAAACAGFIVRRYFAGNISIMTTIGVKGEDEFLAD